MPDLALTDELVEDAAVSSNEVSGSGQCTW